MPTGRPEPGISSQVQMTATVNRYRRRGSLTSIVMKRSRSGISANAKPKPGRRNSCGSSRASEMLAENFVTDALRSSRRKPGRVVAQDGRPRVRSAVASRLRQPTLVQAFDVGDGHGDDSRESGVSAFVKNVRRELWLAVNSRGQPLLVRDGQFTDFRCPQGAVLDDEIIQPRVEFLEICHNALLPGIFCRERTEDQCVTQDRPILSALARPGKRGYDPQWQIVTTRSAQKMPTNLVPKNTTRRNGWLQEFAGTGLSLLWAIKWYRETAGQPAGNRGNVANSRRVAAAAGHDGEEPISRKPRSVKKKTTSQQNAEVSTPSDDVETDDPTSLTLEERRVQDLTELLTDEVFDGEEFLIRCELGEVQVIPPYTLALAHTHPDLNGVLLSVQQRLVDAGTYLVWLVRLLCLAAILCLHLELVETVGEFSLKPLRSPWIYGFLLLLAYLTNTWLVEIREAAVYSRHRQDLFDELQRTDIGLYRLVTKLDGRLEFAVLLVWLKREPGSSRY